MDRYEGFHEFVLARGRALSRTAYLLTGDRHSADDLLQTALMKTVQRWRQVVAGGQPEAYVRRVMINQRTSWWRRARYDRPSRREVTASVSDIADGATERVALARALAQLPPRQRTIVVLRFYDDCSVADTAAALGCSTGTVKSQTHHALARLRRLLPDLDLMMTEAP